ncbi:hypothetical protein AB0F47_19515, partial [Nocardiopsis dassonvillei]
MCVRTHALRGAWRSGRGRARTVAGGTGSVHATAGRERFRTRRRRPTREIPGGQLSNLRTQAVALGLGEHFEEI